MKHLKTIIFLMTLILISSCSEKIYVSKPDQKVYKKGSLMEMNSEDFLIHNNVWNLQSTDNFKFYFDKSINETLKYDIKKTQEENYKRIVNFMGLNTSEFPKITYFLFKDMNQKILLTQVDSDAHAIAPNVYYLPKNALGGQEVGHAITQSVWGFIPNDSEFTLLIDEGFNYFIDNDAFYDGKLDQYAKDYYKAHPSFKISSLTENGKGLRINGGHNQNESYVAGSFVKFLITTYGADRFGKLWKSAVENKVPDFEKIYGQSFERLGLDYENFIK